MSLSFIVFNVQITLALVVVALATRFYLLPRLRALPQHEALAVPLLFSSVRFMGLIFLVPTVTPGMPEAFAIPAAYGDTLAGLLALSAVLANRAGHRSGTPLAWAYVVLGGADLAYGFAMGFLHGLWDHLAGGWTYVIWGAPVVIVALGTTALLLLRPNKATPATRR